MPEPIVTLNEESLRSDPRELVRRTVEEMLNGLLDESESTPIPFTPLRRPRGGILRVPRLELLGAGVPQRGVYPRPVAGAPDAPEDLQRRLVARLERAGVHAPGLDGPHERLHRGVVPRRRYGPMEGLVPAARIVFPSGSDACWEPWPEWRMRPLGGSRPGSPS